jgi:hypothetical protein
LASSTTQCPSDNTDAHNLKKELQKKKKAGNPFWLIGAYAPAGLKSFLKMSKNSEQKFLACI